MMDISRGKGSIIGPGKVKILVNPVLERDSILITTFQQMSPHYATLAPLFAPFGSVMLMGCQVARGQNGRALLQNLANVWKVPVTAGTTDQSTTSPFRLSGPTFTAYPNGGSLNQWASSQEEAIAGRSMAM